MFNSTTITNIRIKGISDVSTERYIFEGEHSWAKYTTHQINVMPKSPGIVTQAFVEGKPYTMVDDKKIDDPESLGLASFLRQANYFWFVMNFKLDDPGAQHDYLGKETIAEIEYHKVKVSYASDVTSKEQNDAYILYINPKTYMVDQFFFSLPAMGVNQPAIKMVVKYEELEGIKVPSKRKVYMPGNDGKLSETPNLVQTSTNIKFSNGFRPQDFMLGG